jgi:DNA-binding transcriptional MerR regulator
MASTDPTLFAYPETDRKKEKSATALRTISEASEALDVPQHVLRFWETKFNQIKPLKRNGGRRFYRPQDLEILAQIKHLLYNQGYTIKGAKKAIEDFARGVDSLTSEQWIAQVPPASVNDNAPDILAEIAEALGEEVQAEESSAQQPTLPFEALRAIRAELAATRHELSQWVEA